MTQFVLPDHEIEALIAGGQILSDNPIHPSQIQPASLDLRLGSKAWRVDAAFTTGKDMTVQQFIKSQRLKKESTKNLELERSLDGSWQPTYLIELQERINFNESQHAYASTKSSIGRLGMIVDIITDYGEKFNYIPHGYKGKLYALVSSIYLNAIINSGELLTQIRVQQEADAITNHIDDIEFSVNLKGDVAGYCIEEACYLNGVFYISKSKDLDPYDWFDKVHVTKTGKKIYCDMNLRSFYIFATKENISIPPDYCAVMTAYDDSFGKFLVHQAGFFDCGFGYGEGNESKAVLEMSCTQTAFTLRDGQAVGTLKFLPMLSRPKKLYGGDGSNYQGQGLRLSKHFKND